jgi:hypothetical protein
VDLRSRQQPDERTIIELTKQACELLHQQTEMLRQGWRLSQEQLHEYEQRQKEITELILVIAGGNTQE